MDMYDTSKCAIKIQKEGEGSVSTITGFAPTDKKDHIIVQNIMYRIMEVQQIWNSNAVVELLDFNSGKLLDPWDYLASGKAVIYWIWYNDSDSDSDEVAVKWHFQTQWN